MKTVRHYDIGGCTEQEVGDYDLAIAMRVCSKRCSHAPKKYPNKMEIVRETISTLAKSCEGTRVKLWIHADNLDSEWRKMFLGEWNQDIKIVRELGVSSESAFRWQLNTLCNQDDAPVVYVLEDDYRHAGSLRPAVERIESAECFISPSNPFAHPQPTIDGWLDIPSTLLSFMCRRHTLIETKSAFEEKTYDIHDDMLWKMVLSSCDYKLFAPLKPIAEHIWEP